MTALLDRYTFWLQHVLGRGCCDEVPIEPVDWCYAIAITLLALLALLIFVGMLATAVL